MAHLFSFHGFDELVIKSLQGDVYDPFFGPTLWSIRPNIILCSLELGVIWRVDLMLTDWFYIAAKISYVYIIPYNINYPSRREIIPQE